MKKNLLVLLAIAALACWLPGQAGAGCIILVDATPVTVSASGTNPASGNPLSAQAIFTLNAGGHTLTVQLLNTENVANLVGQLVPSDILSALFFSPNATLAPLGAHPLASNLINPDATLGNVGQFWAYEDGLVGAPHGATAGISASGYNLFSTGNFAANGQTLDGLNSFEIAPGGFNGTQGNNTVNNADNLVVFENDFFLRVPTELTSLELCDISFQYGTTLNEPNLVPLPGAVLLLGTGLLGLVTYGRKKRQAAA
jgi:hypothetical protein